MKTSSVARRYAKALFELLSPAQVEPTRKGLIDLSQVVSESVSMKHLLASPAYSQDEKLAVLAEICRRMQCPPIVESFLSPLVAKSRAGMLPEIADAFGIIADEAKGAKHLTVQSPTTLSGAEQDQLRTRLRDVLKRNVEVTFETNPTLLAGVYLQMGSLVVDSTLRGRLDAMRSQLSKE